MRAHGREAGWAQLIVVGVADDEPMQAMLRAAGLSVASTWSSAAL
jgi:hypothetical protein